MRYGVCPLLALVTFLIQPVAQATAQDLKSGPQLGQYLPGPFHSYNVTGEHAGRPHCLVCEHGLYPVAIVFARDVPQADQPLAKLLKQLDGAVAKHRAADLGSFVVFLSDDVADPDKREALAVRLRDLAKGLDLKHVVLSLDSADGPSDYNLNKEADITVLLYYKHKVLANYVFRKDTLTDKDVQMILAEVEKMVPGKQK